MGYTGYGCWNPVLTQPCEMDISGTSEILYPTCFGLHITRIWAAKEKKKVNFKILEN